MAWSDSNELLLRMKYSFFSTLVFLLVTNPMTIKLLNINTQSATGYFFQVILFFLIILGLMMFPKDR
jgi:hypothetical protein